MRSERTNKQRLKNIDWLTIIIVLGLVAFGLVTLANVLAEPFTGNEQGFRDITEKISMEFIQRQIVNFLVGVAAMLVMLVIDYNMYKMVIRYVYIANILLLALLLLLQDSSRGVMGWFNFGVRAFQPSELCKVTLTVMLAQAASNMVERTGGIKSIKDLAIILGYFAAPFILVLLQPDFGTAVVFLAILVCILFISKLSWKYVFSLVTLVAAMLPLSYFYLFTDDQKNRINVFLDPELDPQGAGLHVLRSKEAIGSGQMYGKGYFTEGTLAQLKFVPERQTDFIFSGVGEGFGFVGGTVLIVVYFVLIFRWLWVGLRAKDHFGTCIAVGAAGMLLAHVFENIGMTIGLMPVTGIPLPFMSYGGSNLLTNMMAVGMALNVWMRRQPRR
ncbi:MAG: rod shape-determining protein RodA [Clostridiales bacterium]|nr:rod shape-determining protein RodA [Clostridiales bacterium]